MHGSSRKTIKGILWLIKKEIVFIGVAAGMGELLVGTGETNGQEWYVQMMTAAKSTGPAKTVMVLWESAGRTKK